MCVRWSILSYPLNVDWSILSYYIKKCSALIGNLIPKVLYFYCGGLLIKTPPFYYFSYANIRKKIGSTKLNFRSYTYSIFLICRQ